VKLFGGNKIGNLIFWLPFVNEYHQAVPSPIFVNHWSVEVGCFKCSISTMTYWLLVRVPRCGKTCTQCVGSHGLVIWMYLRHFVRVETTEPRYSSRLPLCVFLCFFAHFISFLILSPSLLSKFLTFFVSLSVYFYFISFSFHFFLSLFKLLMFFCLTFFDWLSWIFLLTVLSFHHFFLFSLHISILFRFCLFSLTRLTVCLFITVFCCVWNKNILPTVNSRLTL
jgi:hypothetical protein